MEEIKEHKGWKKTQEEEVKMNGIIKQQTEQLDKSKDSVKNEVGEFIKTMTQWSMTQ